MERDVVVILFTFLDKAKDLTVVLRMLESAVQLCLTA